MPSTSPGPPSPLERVSAPVVLLTAALARAALWMEWLAWPGSRVAVLDAAWNLALGERIAGGDWAAGHATWMVAPGLAYLDALAVGVGGPGTRAPTLLLLAFDLLFAELCRRLGARLGGPAVGLVAGLTAALSAPLAFSALTLVGSGPPGALLGLAMLAALGDHPRRGLRCGLALGASCLFRPNHLLLLPIFALVSALRPDAAPGARWAWRSALAVALGLGLALCPSLLRNRAVGGEWVPISANAGANLYMAHAPGSFSVQSTPPPVANNLTAMTRYFLDTASQGAGRALRPGEADSWWMARALDRLGEDPRGAAKRTLARLYVALGTVAPQDHYAWQSHRRSMPVLGALPDPGWLAPGLGLIGAALGWRAGRRREVLLLAGVVLSIAASLAPFGVVERYRVPGWVALYPLAALGLVEAARQWRAGLLWALGLSLALSWDPFKDRMLLPDMLAFGSTVPWSALDAPREAPEASNVAAAFLRAGQPDQAAPFLRQALQIDPDRVEDRVALSSVLLAEGHRDEAREQASAATQTCARAASPICWTAWYQLALVRRAAGDGAGALEAGLIARDRSPQNQLVEALIEQIRAEAAQGAGTAGQDGISP